MNMFLSILRDIKKNMDSGEQPGEAVTAAMFQTMLTHWQNKNRNRFLWTM